jgi:putative endonuclease
MTYYVYIMASASRVLYIGVTNNIERRAMGHRQGRVPSFSAKYKTKELVYIEAFGVPLILHIAALPPKTGL